MISTFLPVYAALRLTGPPRKTLLGLVARGIVIVVIAPLVITLWLLALLLRLVIAEARQPVAKQPPFDYSQWQVDPARRKLAHSQEAYRRRQASAPKGFEAHVAEPHKLQQ